MLTPYSRSKPRTPTDLFLTSQELKKKKGIKEEVQLTSKQKEMLQNQLDKETSIRKRLQAVRSINCVLQMVSAPSA